MGGWEGASLGEEKMRAGAYIAVPTGRSGFAGFNDLSGLGGVGAAWSCLMPGRGAIREGDGMLAQSWESLLEEGGREAVWAPDRPAGWRKKDLFCRPALGKGSVSPGSVRPQIAKHQSEKTCLRQRLTQGPLIRNRQYNPGRKTCPR